MELIKRNIHMNRQKCQGNIQLTLDDDINVPDVKPDIFKMIKQQGEIRSGEIKSIGDKVQVNGALHFRLLYISDNPENPIQSMSGEIPFEETINLEESCQPNQLLLKWNIEDISAEVINSRKVSVRAVVSAGFSTEDSSSQEGGVDIADAEGVQMRLKKVPITQQGFSKKDTYRVKDELFLPSGKPNIASVLYDEIVLQGTEIRLLDDKVSIKGEMKLFLLYAGEEEGNRIQYLESELPYSGTIDCSGCSEDMTPDIDISIMKRDVAVKPDEDGEQRILDIEVILDLNMKAYQEEEWELLDDLYSTQRKVVPVKKMVEYRNLNLRNNGKARINGKIQVPDGNPGILQLCNVDGTVRMDDTEIVDNGIRVEGAVELQVLYITSEDKLPMYMLKGVLPFSEVLEIPNLNENSVYQVRPAIDQVTYTLMDSREIDAKVALSMETLVFQKCMEEMVTDVKEEEISEQELEDMPGLVGYIVKPQDSWWDIAKHYFTTTEELQRMNNRDAAALMPGEKLLIMKTAADTLL